MKLIVYAYQPGPKLRYIADFVLGQLLGLSYELTDQISDYNSSSLPAINYGTKPLRSQELFLPAHSFLHQTAIADPLPEVFEHRQLPAFFRCELPEADLPFDFFAMAFYLLSRYEEYLPFEADQHGRFSAGQSLAYQKGFLQVPLIDLWALELQQILGDRFPQLVWPDRRFRFQATIDIDMAWSYRYKGKLRSFAALLRDLGYARFSAVIHRLKVWTGRLPDPFFSFDYMEKIHRKLQPLPIYFWLLGQYGSYDKNIDPKHPRFQQLITQQNQQFVSGIHPSYASNQLAEGIPTEKQRLEQIIKQAVLCSRQHFLKLHLPQTYRRLLECGIEEDYSMGYAADTGFRASTAHPFYWYDLEADCATTLVLHPFQAMDVTLQQYLQLSPEEAIERLRVLLESCHKVGGQFCSIWHNSSFTEQSPWQGWTTVYESLIEMASALQSIENKPSA